MSRETLAALNTRTLIGFTEKRGRAWHYRADEQSAEPNHYPGAIPVADVRRRLFNWTAEHSPKKYDVHAEPHEATGYDERGRPVRTVTTTDKVVWRSDNPEVDLGTFGPDYTPRQYQDVLLDGLAHIITPDGLAVTADSLAIGTAGVLRNGGRAWVQVETPDTVTTPEGVDFRPFLMAASSHDGSLSVTYSAGSTLVVCDNTMAIALGEAHSSGHIFKVKHTPNSTIKLEDARQALGILVESADQFAADIATLCATTITEPQFDRFLDEVYPVRKDVGPTGQSNDRVARDLLRSIYTADPRVAPWQGTAFGALQLMSTYRHHFSGIAADRDRGERNMLHAIGGETRREDRKVLQAIQKVLVSA
ncbi:MULTISPECIES: DUF932 domain-containing protein [Nocardia]|uniref:DUF932 domain-containing protein n=1 Tax=Nocardia TaxID=1817 RepID=UPI0024566010|nr:MULTISPECIES: DUF932 domain-containing protein [Nocardia]